jgi:hypothetical protein
MNYSVKVIHSGGTNITKILLSTEIRLNKGWYYEE